MRDGTGLRPRLATTQFYAKKSSGWQECWQTPVMTFRLRPKPALSPNAILICNAFEWRGTEHFEK
jgi:hypothetical protein